MDAVRDVVIVGAGLAGAKAAESLRALGYDGSIVVVGDEAHLPYERPALSKGYLAGEADRPSLDVHDSDWYDTCQVQLRLGVSATNLDAKARRLTLTDGVELRYDKLLIATGSRPRRLPLPGTDASGVRHLRTVADADLLRADLAAASRLVIVGGGWIGLEVAATARQAGVEVVVLEAGPLPLLRVLGPEMAAMFTRLHRDHGVRLVTDARLTHFTVAGDGAVSGVALADGTVVEADRVLVGIGVEPNVELAVRAGLQVENGIVTDASLRSSSDDVFAAGDVANAFSPVIGRQVRVEHWATALHQPEVAAAAMLGRPDTYDLLPYFYTDQYDLGMEYVGFAGPEGYDRLLVRGSVEDRKFLAFWLRTGRVIAGMSVNVWDVVDDMRALVTSKHAVDIDRLADLDVPLDSLSRR